MNDYLYHKDHKYIWKEKKSGKWRYYYEDYKKKQKDLEDAEVEYMKYVKDGRFNKLDYNKLKELDAKRKSAQKNADEASSKYYKDTLLGKIADKLGIDEMNRVVSATNISNRAQQQNSFIDKIGVAYTNTYDNRKNLTDYKTEEEKNVKKSKEAINKIKDETKKKNDALDKLSKVTPNGMAKALIEKQKEKNNNEYKEALNSHKEETSYLRNKSAKYKADHVVELNAAKRLVDKEFRANEAFSKTPLGKAAAAIVKGEEKVRSILTKAKNLFSKK